MGRRTRVSSATQTKTPTGRARRRHPPVRRCRPPCIYSSCPTRSQQTRAKPVTIRCICFFSTYHAACLFIVLRKIAWTIDLNSVYGIASEIGLPVATSSAVGNNRTTGRANFHSALRQVTLKRIYLASRQGLCLTLDRMVIKQDVPAKTGCVVTLIIMGVGINILRRSCQASGRALIITLYAVRR